MSLLLTASSLRIGLEPPRIHALPPSYQQLPSNLVPSSKAGGLILPPAYDCIKKHSSKRIMLPLPADRSVAKTRKGSFGFGKKAVELSLTVADNLVFLYPNSAEGSTSDVDAVGVRPRATFIVSITLSIAEGIAPPPPIEKMTVELRGLESLGFPQGLEQNVIHYAEQKVEDACSLELVPGQAYKWEVPIEIPHDVAPYERMKFGRVFQKMRVKLEWQSQSWLSKYKDLQVERDVWIVCIPRISNMLDYARTHRTVQEHLGPMSIHIRSHHLTIGSYLRLGLYLPSMSSHCKILRLELSTIQFTFLHSRKRVGAVFRDCTPERIPFLTVEGDEFREKMQNNQVDWIARLPSCDRIRPSTLKGSEDAAIRLSHKLEIRIYFSTEKTTSDKPLVYSAQWPIILPSCACRWRSLKLPSYSKYDPSPVPDGTPLEGEMDPNGIAYRGRLRSHRDQTDCSCGIPLEKILKFEDEFEEAQKTCLTQLMTQELLSGNLTADPPSLLSSPLLPTRSSEGLYPAEEDGELTYDTNDYGIDLSLAPDEEEVREQKAGQAYIPESSASGSYL